MKKFTFLVVSIIACSTCLSAQEQNEAPILKTTVGFRAGLNYNFYTTGFSGKENDFGTVGQIFVNRTLGKKQNWHLEFNASHLVFKAGSYLDCGTPPIILTEKPLHSIASTIAIRRKFLNIGSLSWKHYIGVSAGYMGSRVVSEAYYGESVPKKTLVTYASTALLGLDYAGSIGICNKFSLQYLLNLNSFPYRQNYYYFQKDLGLNFSVGIGYSF